MGRKSREKKERKQEKLVVFVCTANVCRSPMAEKLFVDALEKTKSKKNIKVFSAGISAMDGDQASENSISVCKEIGLDLEDHRSAALTRPTAENASVIFCMTESHRALLQMYFELPEKTQVFLMREFMEDGKTRPMWAHARRTDKFIWQTEILACHGQHFEKLLLMILIYYFGNAITAWCN